jgi:4-hydroxybenzoate polyprenyltransferase
MTAPGRPAAVSSRSFWRAYWITLRPYLFFVSGTSGLVGLALAPALEGGKLAAGFAAFFLSYGLGQALTDVFQVDTDSLSSPYRPLVRGAITRRQVLWVSLAGLGACAALLALLNPWTLALSFAAVAGLATYTPLKRRWWGGPPWNAWIVALLAPMGALCGGASLGDVFSSTFVWLAAASLFSSYAIFVLLGYFKDVEADRATGYETLPVRFGRRISVGVSALFLLAAALATSLLLWRSGRLPPRLEAGPILATLLWAAGLVLLALAHARILGTTRDEEAHPAIAHVVRGYVALHAGEASLLRGDLVPWALGLTLLFEIALAVRPSKTQI